MLAPLISSSTLSSSKRKYGLPPRKGLRVNAAGYEMRAEVDGKEKVGEYLRSDSYLSAHLMEWEWFGVSVTNKVILDPRPEGAPCLTKKDCHVNCQHCTNKEN